MKTLRKQENESRLERTVRLWLNSKGRDYETGWRGAYDDLVRCRCSSGFVDILIYYKDTSKFFEKHKEEINDLLVNHDIDITALNGWDGCDPLVLGPTNKNLLAWVAFEETAYQLAESMHD